MRSSATSFGLSAYFKAAYGSPLFKYVGDETWSENTALGSYGISTASSENDFKALTVG
jgi:hypothetical protein